MPQLSALGQPEAARLEEAYRAVRARTVALSDGLSDADATVQSMPDASPVKWHLAHTTWFFETFLLAEYLPGYQVFDPGYAFLFNSYYEGAGPRHARPRRGLPHLLFQPPPGAHGAAPPDRPDPRAQTAGSLIQPGGRDQVCSIW